MISISVEYNDLIVRRNGNEIDLIIKSGDGTEKIHLAPYQAQKVAATLDVLCENIWTEVSSHARDSMVRTGRVEGIVTASPGSPPRG